MGILCMDSVLKDPIRRNIFFLAVIFFIGLAMLIGVQEVLRAYNNKYEISLENQRARYSLGKIILKKLLLIELDIKGLVSTSDPRDLGVLEKRITTSIQDIHSALRVLREGGVYEDVMPANFGNVNEIKERIFFSRAKRLGYVIEVIDLTPKIIDIGEITAELVETSTENFKSTDAKKKAYLAKTSDLSSKHMDTVLVRSRETANKIFYDTGVEIGRLEKERKSAIQWLTLVRYGVIGVIGIAGIFICIFTIVKVGHILNQREAYAADLREANKTIERILEAVPAGIAVIGHDYIIRNVNKATLRLLKANSAEEIVGKKCSEMFLCPKEKCPLIDKKKSIYDSEVELQTLTGSRLPVIKSAIHLKLKDEPVVIEAFMDISDRKSKEAAEAASRAKSEFLATMSHEIRTPLNGVMGMLQLIMNTKLDDEQKGYVDIALKSGRGLLTVLNDILDVSRIEAGRIELREEKFELEEVLRSTTEPLRGQAEKKNVSLHYHIADGVPQTLVGDGGRIRQILFNLIGNSIKFTEQGEVRVEVCPLRIGTDREYMHLLFSISDTGVGIPDDKIEYVFGAFTQMDGSYARRYQGSGLGLGIVKRFVTLMGGSIAVESEGGTGTTVHFFLKLRRPKSLPEKRWSATGRRRTDMAAAPADEVKPPEFSPERRRTAIGRRRTDISFYPLKVLVVEDNPVNRIFAVKLLEKLGHEAVAVEHGKEAIKALEKNSFDAVLMDVQMPEMDGIEATKKIRAAKSAPFNPNVPIIAMTAHAMDGDEKEFLGAGMDGYIAKPVDMDALAKVLAKAMGWL